MEHKIISTLKRNDSINVIGKIDDWYVVLTNKNIVGACKAEYIKNVENITTEEIILGSINEKRNSADIQSLIMNDELTKVAKKIINNEEYSKINIQVIENELANSNIEYMTIGYFKGEFANIDEIKEKLINTVNSISNDYNATGISIVEKKSNKYIVLQLFTGK